MAHLDTMRTDVVVIGASVAGTTAATLFAREGLSALLVDRIRDVAAFKKQCTHFIQASATPVLERLGVVDAMERAGAVRNGLQAWTPAGWVRLAMDGERDPQGRRTHGYTLRRERLDPILRGNARTTAGVALRLGYAVKALVRDGQRVVGVDIEGEGRAVRVLASLVVGADGRHTKVAQLAQIPSEVLPHTRSGFFAYYRGAPTRTGTDAQLWFLGENVAYSFPSDDGLLCLAAAVHDRNLAGFKADREGYLRAFYAGLPDAPDLSQAARASDFVGFANTPNIYRWPVLPGLALIGDAAMASDYIWGVGCGWALQSASSLVDHVAPALKAGTDLRPGLRRYARRHRAELHTQHVQNAAFSATDRLPFLVGAVLAAATDDVRLRQLIALAGAGRISQRDVRIPLRLALYHLTRPFRRPADGAGATVFVAPPAATGITHQEAPSSSRGLQELDQVALGVPQGRDA
jgi:2-polyprenyl-6-methoxyphenol hydroxylase-like FAD-dependent oxidoreductase